MSAILVMGLFWVVGVRAWFCGCLESREGASLPPNVNPLRGADWQDLACIQGLERRFLLSLRSLCSFIKSI